MYLQREVGETKGLKETLQYMKDWSVPSTLGKRRENWQQPKMVMEITESTTRWGSKDGRESAGTREGLCTYISKDAEEDDTG